MTEINKCYFLLDYISPSGKKLYPYLLNSDDYVDVWSKLLTDYFDIPYLNYEGASEGKTKNLINLYVELNKKKYDTGDGYNKEALIHFLSCGDIDLADLIFVSRDLDLSNVDNAKLFNKLSEYDAIILLTKILKNKKYGFDGYKIYGYLHPNTSIKFLNILLHDSRFDISLFGGIPNFLSKSNTNAFLSDPRVNITNNYLIYKPDIMKIYIKNSLNGLLVMDCLYNRNTNKNISSIYTSSQYASDTEEFYYRFLRYLVVKKPAVGKEPATYNDRRCYMDN